MRRTLILLLSVAVSYIVDGLKLSSIPSPVLDACATVDCASGLVCALAIPQSCNVSPCPKMPTCLPKNQTCDAKSCKSDETCVLRSVTCVMAPCYPVRECAKYPKCGENEEYNECSLSGPCEPNCDDSFPICTNVTCGSGACECLPGFFRHKGKCISKDKCPEPTCDKPKEVWNTCPSACTQTCRILRGKEEQMACPAVCGLPQCTCAPGYVRDDDWNCVKTEDCPTEFKCSSPHEEFIECSSHCEPTCENRTPSCIESCGPAKCQCKKDYVRHEGSCLFALQCPLEANSTISLPRPVMENSGSAEEEDDNSKEGPSCDGVRCSSDSVCSLKGGKAVCSKCAKNEKIDKCPNPCSETTCDDNGAVRRCMKMCGPQPRCVCDDGFVREMRSGRCIKKNQCPKGDNGTMHILPIFNGPLVDPIPDRNGTMHILPHNENDTMISLPYIPGNETMHILPIHSRILIRPLLPDNETMHIMPIGNGAIHTLPYIPRSDEGAVHIMPVFNNRTRPQVMPLRPDENGTFTGPLIRPAFPDMHIMPHIAHIENGTMISLPYVPNFNGSENGTMNILPFIPPKNNLTRPLVMPLIPSTRPAFTGPLVRPAFPDGNGTMHILPHSDNDTILIDPIFHRPMTRPAFTVENGTMHIMPFENETMHILPHVPIGKDQPLVDPIPFSNTTTAIPHNGSTPSSSVCATHKCPAGSWCEETQVQCIRAPCLPIPTCVSTTTRRTTIAHGGTTISGKSGEEKCGKNEEHVECAPQCQETCRGNSGCVEAMVCKPGCVCKEKFKRDGHGVCVPNHKCWKTAGCEENEVWHKCRPCEPTCTDKKEVCTAECSSGCGCVDGFVRGPKGTCILQKSCPAKDLLQ